MGLGDGDSNSSRQTGPQTSVERVTRNQEARRKARRNAQWKDDSRNQGGANGNTSNADGRRETDEGNSPKRGQRRQHQRHRTRRRGCLTGRVRDINVGRRRGGESWTGRTRLEEEHLGVKVKVRANEGG
ncbi:hypothetical protein E4U57_007228 [Claviceps arundinis]|uniref:Uncharacterized protein n=1 Tax=Claviceps arundinis TaxID=1623583 RepID=A0ABQ7PFI4_9HYPO|nr:hypothetical protein E4U57_007228 [Claviceps arundinis]